MNRLSEGVSTAAAAPGGGAVVGNDDGAYLGKVLGGYRVESVVTSIPRVRVYSAREASSGAEATLKVIDPGEADAATVDRFLKEAHAAGSLGHPNVVATRAVGKTGDGSVYQVTEVVTGTTLEQAIQSGQFPVPRAVGIATQVAAALNAVHGMGLAHAFLNPTNVTIVRRGDAESVKVGDFGFAHFNGLGRGLGKYLGPANCMAPEQMSSAVADVRADVYALGTLLYAMLAGEVPFAKAGVRDIQRAIVEDEPAKLRLLRPDLRVSLLQVVNRAMRKSREDRFQSVHDLREALGRLEGGGVVGAATVVGLGSQEPTPPPPASQPSPPSSSRGALVGSNVSAVPAAFAPTLIAMNAAAATPAETPPPPAPVASPPPPVVAAPVVAPPPTTATVVGVPPAPAPASGTTRAAKTNGRASTPPSRNETSIPAPAAVAESTAAVAVSASAVDTAPRRAIPVVEHEDAPPQKKKGAMIFIPAALIAVAAAFFGLRAMSGGQSTSGASPAGTLPVSAAQSPQSSPQSPQQNAVNTPPTTPPNPVALAPDPAQQTAQAQPTKGGPGPRPVFTRGNPPPAPAKPVAAPPPAKATPAPVAPPPAAPAAAAPAPADAPAPPQKRAPKSSAELEPEEYFESYPAAKKK